MNDAPNVNEHSRLLEHPVDWASNDGCTHTASTWWKTWRVAILCYIVAWLADLGDAMRKTPKIRLIESIICRRYYKTQGSHGNTLASPSPWPLATDIDEGLCKLYEIQAELAMTQAWLKVGENLFSFLLAIPFGHLADRMGRNYVLTLGMVGQIVAEVWIIIACSMSDQLPFQLIYFSVILKSAGGGASVLSALLHAILTDVMPRERQAQAFFYLASSSLLTEVIAPPLGSILMVAGTPYTPLLFGFPLELLALVFISTIPNTSKIGKQRLASRVSTGSEELGFACSTANTNPYQDDDNVTEPESKYLGLGDQLMLVYEIMTRDRDVLRVIVAFVVTSVARENLDFVVQYTSERFGWSLSKANYLTSFRASVNLALLALILPAVCKLLTQKHGMLPAQVDLWIARGSTVFGAIGSMMMGLSPSPTPLILSLLLFTFSAGFSAAIQSYATYLVDPSELTTLFSALAVVGIAGTLAASPLAAATFKLGMSIGGVGLGLPFLFGAAFFVTSGIGVWTTRMPGKSNHLQWLKTFK